MMGEELKEQDKVEWLAERLFQMHILKVGLIDKDGTAQANHVASAIVAAFTFAEEFYRHASSLPPRPPRKWKV